MKKAYSQFLKELPSKKIVFAFGRFQPPTIGHELLVKAVEKLAKEQNADHVIYASHSHDSSKNPLPVDRKVYYLQRMFPEAKFKAAGGTTRTFIEVAKELNKRYKNIIMVAGSDRVPEYKKLLEKYNGKDFNFDTISVVSAGERDPDADNASGMSGTKMREAAKKGDFNTFKKGLPHTLTTVDGKRLMNEIREGMGLEAIKEQVKLATDWLRESYFRGEIYKIGQIVESNGQRFEILDRGSNYITVVDSVGNTHRKWLTDVTLAEDYNVPHQDLPKTSFEASQISYKGYNTKHFDHDPDAFVAFHRTIHLPDVDPVAVLNAIKATDQYMEILKQVMSTDSVTEQQHHAFDTLVEKAQEYLMKTGDLQHHVDYINSAIHMMNQTQAQYHKEIEDRIEESMITFKQITEMKFTSSDKVKVARIIADALGVADVEKSSNAEQLVNNALRKLKSKTIRPEYATVVKHMLQTADEAGIEYDKNLVPGKVNEGYDEVQTSDTKLDKSGRVIHARKLRFKNATRTEKDDEDEQKKKEDMKEGYNHHDNRTGFGRRRREDDEYHVPDSQTRTHKVGFHVSKDGGEKHHRTVTISNSTKTPAEARATARAHLEKQGYKIHEEAAPSKKVKESETAEYDESKPKINDTGKISFDALKNFMGLQKVHKLKPGELSAGAVTPELKTDGIPVSPDPLRVKHQRMHEEEEKKNVELTDADFDEELKDMDELEDIIDAYEDEELAIVDDESGEELDTDGFTDDDKEEEAKLKENRIVILEISRMERIRRKQRFARTKSKRQVRAQIALRKTSTTATISKRARKLAISMIKKRMLRKDPSQATMSEKERVEKFIEKRKAVIDRLARRVAPRIRQIEKARLQHKRFTK